MPSRKKAKGKARKAAREAKAKEEESRAVVEVAAANQRQEESVEAMMHRLVINDAMPQKCRHGLVPLSLSAGEKKICQEFINAYIAAFCSQQNVVEGLKAAIDATTDKYHDVYASKLDTVISSLLCNGTQCILDGNNRYAQLYACIAFFCEDVMAVDVHKTQAAPCCSTIIELESADDRTLVSYYRKRIPCACLDEKYKEVKSLKKMGLCYNLSCSHPKRTVERSKMFCCTRCGDANYCSVACQKNHWKEHKEQCDKSAKLRAAFDSEQS